MQLMPELDLDITAERLIVRYPGGFRVCSSAVWNGGLTQASTLVNLRVPKGYSSGNPQEDLHRALQALGEDPTDTVGLLTAAWVEDAGIVHETGNDFQLWAIVTAGVGNAVRAGKAAQTFPAYAAGTINTIVILDARVTDGALVNSIITATEAKAAALQDGGTTDEQGRIATGTSTDAVVIACTNRSCYRHIHPYAGTATEIGDALARAVYRATLASLEQEAVRRREHLS